MAIQRLKFTVDEIEKVLDGRYNSFRQAIGDSTYTSGSPLTLSAGVEVLLTNDTLLTNDVTSPSHITSRYNSTTNKIAMPEELDHPTYVNDIQFYFAPDTAAAGTITIRIYIDESGTRNFTTDPEIRSYVTTYKATTDKVDILATWYFGSDTGYDAKNNGVYFTAEASSSGGAYEIFESIYRT